MPQVSVVGDIVAAPGPPKALGLMKREAGIVFIVLSYAGDVMSAGINPAEAFELTTHCKINDNAPTHMHCMKGYDNGTIESA